MTKKEYKDFTDLKVWQKSRDSVIAVFHLVDQIPEPELTVLGNELKQLALRMSMEIAQAHYTYGKEGRIALLSSAKRSMNGLQSHLYLTRDLELVKSKDLEPVFNEITECSKLLIGFIKYFEERDQPKEAQSA